MNPPLALAEIAEHQPTDRDPDQAQHLQVEGRQQAADMAVAALVEDHLQPCGLVAAAQHAHGLGSEELAFVLHARLQRHQRGVIGHAIHLHVVGLDRSAALRWPCPTARPVRSTAGRHHQSSDTRCRGRAHPARWSPLRAAC
ncbi:hypothetical protein G6F31_019265 [Rhizopus arrhizus]|nr:hypothetical protein G6F31_019265 [Rhizopus arrhizus]